MTYTPAKPAVPGWYWLRWPKVPVAVVVRVYPVGKELRCWINDQPIPLGEGKEWEWAGPIPEPDEG